MSAVAFLQKMLDAGLSLADAMKAAAAFEEATAIQPPARTKGAVRQARYEERRRQKASESVTPDASDDTDVFAPSLPSPPQTPPQPTHPRGEIYTPARDAAWFDAFWAAYPRKVAKDPARKAFAKAIHRMTEDDPLAVILAGIERALPGWTDPNFIPHPASWLNAGRWSDEAPNVTPLRANHGKPDKLTARHDNYAASWSGSEQAAGILAARRNL